MDFTVFPVMATNIFPIANSVNGGQLVTEFNLRTRESVGTPEHVKYMIGPSYVHAEDDFYVSALTDSAGPFSDTAISSHILEIHPGRGVINGHFVETLVPLTIDLLTANADAKLNNLTPLSGDLVVGLRIMYSTEQTMAGAMQAENGEYYEGIKVVILPKSEFKLPTDTDACENINLVTAHLKLAEFKFYNGTITNVINNYPAKCTMFPASRIGEVDKLLSDIYLRKSGLNPKKLYTFAGYGTIDDQDTWCDSTDALMVWDKGTDADMLIEVPMSYKETNEAHFRSTETGKVQLYLPHKQPHYDVPSANGNKYIYRPKTYDLPVANFESGTPGTVDSSYTQHIKNVVSLINNLYNLPAGKQRYYISDLNSIDELPPINTSWVPGDYILVARDYTLESSRMDSTWVTKPSSMYVVLPGFVSAISYSNTTKPSGVELGWISMTSDDIVGSDKTKPSNDSTIYNTYFNYTSYRGIAGSDYFRVEFTNTTGAEPNVTNYYYIVTHSGAYAYSDPILLTGEIPLAETTLVGGFLNVDETATDYGYVIRDSEGHLRLLDYALLRSGTLAYQLGEDFTTPNGLTAAEIQGYLDEYVNQRVAFPNFNHTQNAENPNVINVNIYLSAESDSTDISERTLNIYDLDSRFNTSVCINIYGTADSNTIINISDCQRVRIGTVAGTPIINLYRSNLYYDSNILDMLSTVYDLRLWYQKFDDNDANLIVDGMTVREIGVPVQGQGVEFWDVDTPNDNHYMFALQSLTFDSNANIIGCSMLVKNTSTSNVEQGKSIIVGSYEIPQGNGFTYPKTRLTKRIKVTGQFVSAYWTGGTDPANPWLVQDTSFTAVSQVYNPYDTNTPTSKGSISFLVDSFYVSNINGISHDITSIDGWEPDTYHVFAGNTIT